MPPIIIQLYGDQGSGLLLQSERYFQSEGQDDNRMHDKKHASGEGRLVEVVGFSSPPHGFHRDAKRCKDTTMSKSVFRTFVVVLCMSIGCSCSTSSSEQTDIQAIAWESFTWKEMERLVGEGDSVLLFCHPTSAVPDDYQFEEFDDPRLIGLYSQGEFVARTLKYSDWEGNEIRTVFKRVGHTKYPMVILFRPNREPLRIDVLVVDQWLEEIASNRR
ncbi:hypothetical protein [Planctomycetes bacterium TBK1r]|uniref:Uncharacterized protein n=1 Tax=Stieleria magnilauensis TaxID=2527963 RepID=A0ABX5XVR3_9BACT|nr:hypothetical protein TBK1r_50610 [Planctomycetes bacterium TBK1r]